MLQPLNNAMLFLLSLAFDIYLIIIILRVLLPWVGADYYNPISQFINKATNPLINPIQKFLPHAWSHYSGAIVLLLFIEILQMVVLSKVAGLPLVSVSSIMLMIIADIVSKLVSILFYAIIIRTIWSWINPNLYHPVRDILYLLTEPLLAPIRTYVKPVSGFDFSPIIALILLQLVLILFVYPILY